MPSSYSTSLRFEMQLTGEGLNVWGVRLSNAVARVDDAVAGYVAVTIAGDYSLVSSNNNAASDEARMAHVKLNGSPAVNFSLTSPAVSKSYWIWNNTAKTATHTTGSGTTYPTEAGDVQPVWTDGTNYKGITYDGLPLKDFIAAAALGTIGDLPAQGGNAGKFVKTDGTNATWQQIQSTDIGDFVAAVRRKVLLYTLIFGS